MGSTCWRHADAHWLSCERRDAIWACCRECKSCFERTDTSPHAHSDQLCLCLSADAHHDDSRLFFWHIRWWASEKRTEAFCRREFIVEFDTQSVWLDSFTLEFDTQSVRLHNHWNSSCPPGSRDESSAEDNDAAAVYVYVGFYYQRTCFSALPNV